MSLMWHIKKYFHNKSWRKQNKHNYTTVANLFDFDQVIVGKATYGSLYVMTDGKDAKLRIGHFCSIAPNVAFILQSDHQMKCFSTYPFKVMNGLERKEAVTKGDILVDDDVWIGYGAIVLSGVHIGRGAVIGAGSVVTKNVPPYSVVVGKTSNVIKKRFDEEIINVLLKIDYSRVDQRLILDDLEKLYKQIKNVEDAEELLVMMENAYID